MRVVIMAGGRGQRLHPLTENAPKPLLEVGAKPMIQEVIEEFISQDFTDFIISVHYLGELIKDYLSDGSNFGCDIDYIDEAEPLGTAGALYYVPDDEPVIVCNADIQAKLDYKDLVKHHTMAEADATMCLALYQHQVEYGVVEIENGHMTSIDEKPIKNYPVSAGINVISPSALVQVPPQPIDMPDLLLGLDNVSTYYISGHWQDIGTFETYEAAGGKM